MHRRTKIVATLGPATDHKKTLLNMIDAGLDVARINFSHGDAAEHRRRAEQLRAAAAECRRDVGLLGDLQGPKIRVQRFRERAVELAMRIDGRRLSVGGGHIIGTIFDRGNGRAVGGFACRKTA